MSDNAQAWYVVKQQDDTCTIVAVAHGSSPTASSWGPFASQQEAIAKRVGLIRARKCQPQ